MKSYRRYAAVVSILAHAVALGGLSLILWQPVPKQSEDVIVYLEPPPGAPKVGLTIPRRQQARASHTAETQPLVATQRVQAVAPREPLLAEAIQADTLTNPERQFLGDTLYSILQNYPQLKPTLLKQLIIQNVRAYDSLAIVERQIAEALAPYLEMSEAELAARSNMKRFGYAHNPHHVQAIPGNIPISAILFYLIHFFTQ